MSPPAQRPGTSPRMPAGEPALDRSIKPLRIGSSSPEDGKRVAALLMRWNCSIRGAGRNWRVGWLCSASSTSTTLSPTSSADSPRLAVCEGDISPIAASLRNRPHRRTWAFQAMSRSGFGIPSKLLCSFALTPICPSALDQSPASAPVAGRGQTRTRAPSRGLSFL